VARANSPRNRAERRALKHYERQAKTALRGIERIYKARSRRTEREIARLGREVTYASRVYGRSAAARLRAQQREIERQYRAEVREAARARRALVKFFTPAKRRTTYQRRVVSKITRRVERGETAIRINTAADVVNRPSADGMSIPFIAEGGNVIYLKSDNSETRGELANIWANERLRPSNAYKKEGKRFRDDRTLSYYTPETDMNVVQSVYDQFPTDYLKQIYRGLQKA
jgi:hypothetical protein